MQLDTVADRPDTCAEQGERPWVCPRDETCSSTRRHDVRPAYADGCRSGLTLRAMADYQADLRTNGPRTTDSTGTARRLQALHALGWSDVYLAGQLYCTHQRVRELRVRKLPRVYRKTAEDVAWLFLELSETDPPASGYVERTKRQAREAGEVPPDAWDIDTIDDPRAKPYAPAANRLRLQEAAENRERIVLLVTAGQTIQQIADELGLSTRSVERHRARLIEEGRLQPANAAPAAPDRVRLADGGRLAS